MLISSISRLFSPSSRSQSPKVLALRFSTSLSAAETFYRHLQACPSNVEKALASVKVKVDASCVSEVIGRCRPNQFQLGLRFFVWAGTRSDYRHTSFMYSKACDVFKIGKNPGTMKDVIEAYRAEECFVSVKTMKVVLNLCKQAKLADDALWVLRRMPEFNLRADTTVFNLVIRLFVDKGDLNTADKLMKEMGLIDLYPDMITYVSMINGFCNVGRLEDACRLAQVMRSHGCVPNAVTHSRLLEGVCKSGNMVKALELLDEMEKEDSGFNPNTVTYTLVIQAFCERKRVGEALEILDRMEARGCLPNRVTASTLIKGLLEDGNTNEAYKLIDRLTKSGRVPVDECYSSLMISLARMRRRDEAEKLFREMLACGMRPDGLACSFILREVCSEERYLDCFRLYEEIEKMKVISTIDSDIFSVLLLGLCKQGHSLEASQLARLMLEKRIRLNALYVDKIIEHLKKVGDKDLMLHLPRI